jgi:hypothetical protein
MDLEPASLVSKQSVKDALILDETTVGTLQIGAMHLNQRVQDRWLGRGGFLPLPLQALPRPPQLSSCDGCLLRYLIPAPSRSMSLCEI